MNVTDERNDRRYYRKQRDVAELVSVNGVHQYDGDGLGRVPVSTGTSREFKLRLACDGAG
jgi:hypothetical protein